MRSGASLSRMACGVSRLAPSPVVPRRDALYGSTSRRSLVRAQYGPSPLPTGGWEQHGDHLAATLSAADYASVAHAFARARDLERGFLSFLAPGSPHKGLTRDGVEVVPLKAEIKPSVQELLEQADAACQILGALAYADEEDAAAEGSE